MRRRLPPLTLAAWLLAAGTLPACNVPVFRYALDRWRPDPCEVYVFHRGRLSERDREAVRLLEQAADGRAANVDLEVIDLAGRQADPLRALFDEQRGAELPWVVVRTTNVDGEKVTVWSGRPDAESVAAVLDSLTRRELASRILAGETAVWLLLESGDRARDDAAERLLRSELERLTPRLKLPKLTDDPDDRLAPQGPPLRVAFSVIRLRRDDPSEQLLVRTLLCSEGDLPGRREPMAFAAFGRGRCLAALVGRGLNADNVRKSCRLLLAPCTCDVQGQLACFDLLVSADWGAPLEPAGVRVPLPSSRPRPAAAPQDGVETLIVEEDRSAGSRRVLLGAIGVAALLVVVTGVWALRSRRR